MINSNESTIILILAIIFGAAGMINLVRLMNDKGESKELKKVIQSQKILIDEQNRVMSKLIKTIRNDS